MKQGWSREDSNTFALRRFFFCLGIRISSFSFSKSIAWFHSSAYEKNPNFDPLKSPMGASEFRFFLSCDINSPVTFRIEKLDGTLPVKISTDSGTESFDYVVTGASNLNWICSFLVASLRVLILVISWDFIDVMGNCLLLGV